MDCIYSGVFACVHVWVCHLSVCIHVHAVLAHVRAYAGQWKTLSALSHFVLLHFDRVCTETGSGHCQLRRSPWLLTMTHLLLWCYVWFRLSSCCFWRFLFTFHLFFLFCLFCFVCAQMLIFEQDGFLATMLALWLRWAVVKWKTYVHFFNWLTKSTLSYMMNLSSDFIKFEKI